MLQKRIDDLCIHRLNPRSLPLARVLLTMTRPLGHSCSRRERLALATLNVLDRMCQSLKRFVPDANTNADTPVASASLPLSVNCGSASDFLQMYYDAGHSVDTGMTWKDTWWMGVRLQKLPMDLWLYQEILYECRPDIIVECGTAFGGSALYLANICDLLDVGRVITIDIDEWNVRVDGYSGRPLHHRLTYIQGSSTEPGVVTELKKMIPNGSKVMVVLDSDHTEKHVAEELAIYSQMVSPGQFLVLEDTMLNGHPVHADFGPGPMEALQTFLGNTNDFFSDPIGDKFFISFNPKGFLRRRFPTSAAITELIS